MSRKCALKPLKDRMTEHQAERRAQRIEARQTVAQQLGREHAITRGIVVTVFQVLQRGFWGRLKWIFLGK